jgi:hypothetical protein
MKKHTIHLAGLALAAGLFTLPTLGQGAVPPSRPLPPPKHLEHVEIETSDDGPFAIARGAFGDADKMVRKIFAGPGEGGDRPLIISSSTPDEKSLANLDEDLNIMARVLDKSISRGSDGEDRKAMGIHLWATGAGNRASRNLYIEGHGAIFILNVPMPLLPPPSKPQVEEKKEAASSTWEEARNELYGHDDERGGMKHRQSDKRPSVPYDAARVDDLKKDLAEALKNATHIRGLKDSETVTIVIQGAGSGVIQRARAVPPKGEVESDIFAFAYAPGLGGGRSVMTLRAKKNDIDAFAKGKTELDDFRKKVSIATYQAPSGGGGEPSRPRF